MPHNPSLRKLEQRVERLSRVLDEIADGTTPDRIGRYEYLRDWVHKTAMTGLARETDDEGRRA